MPEPTNKPAPLGDLRGARDLESSGGNLIGSAAYGPMRLPPSTLSATEQQALKRCQEAGHTQGVRFGQPVACAHCLRAVLLGERRYDPASLPSGTHTLVRETFAAINDGGARTLGQITAAVNAARQATGSTAVSEPTISARLRDIRKLGYIIDAARQPDQTTLYALRLDG
jgi:DNA-binding transcriptional ArsR family regulator